MAAITESEVRALFNVWNGALATGDPKKVAACYTKDAVLLPTVSDRARYDPEGIEDYFVNFLKKKPSGEILEGKIKIGTGWAQDAGIYEFTMGVDGSKVRGRYSYVYVHEGGEWKISHHHSSVLPEGVLPAPISEAEVRALFGKWNAALGTGEPKKVAECYTKDAVLLPTVSDKGRYDPPAVEDYFVTFLKKKPVGEILEGKIKIGTNWAQDAGIYEFTMGVDGSKVKGRYSYVYSFEGGEWKISHHHSSIMPEAALDALSKVAK